MRTYTYANLTQEDIRTLCQFAVRVPSYTWLDKSLLLDAEEKRRLADITSRLQRDKTSIMNEATLWARAIYPLLMLAEQDYMRVWSQVPLHANYPHMELQGIADGILGMSVSGDIDVPYLLVIEAKRGLESPDPRPQLYGQLLAAARLNWQHSPRQVIDLFGCYTIIDSWTFVYATVQQIDSDSPSLTVELSREYTQKTEAETILLILKQIVARYAEHLPDSVVS
jgi:hypothetical protein